MLGYTPPPVQCMLGYGQQAGGTHPTGMHSCFIMILKQECIPVGCVPAARRLYARVCFPGGCLVQGWGGVPGPGGWCAWSGGACLVRGVCLVWGGGVPGPGGRGVSALGGSASVPCGIPPPPPPCEQNDKQVQKYYLGHKLRCGR